MNFKNEKSTSGEAILHLSKDSVLTQLSTKVLVDELMKREGVEVSLIGPSARIEMTADGPAIVLVVID